MKRINTLYYLLFVLLIFGSFASMAQNIYGQKILGTVAIIFCISFAVQFVSSLQQNKTEWINALELGSLTVLSAVLAMRVFYIRLGGVEEIFGLSGLLLMGIQLRRLWLSWQELSVHNRVLALLIGLFYFSLVLYTFSMVSVPFLPFLSEPSGGLAFALMVVFGLLGTYYNGFMIEGERVSPFEFVFRLKSKAVLLAALFLLFTAYMGLTKVNALPKMYSNEFPQAYFELVKRAESGTEISRDGYYKHEEFKKRYELLLKRHSDLK